MSSPAVNAQLNNPAGLFVSKSGEVFFADYGNHRIRKILTNGNIVTIAGNGIKGYSGDNDLATNAKINSPYGVYVSKGGEVLFTDFGNHRIRKILTNGNITTIAGNGIPGYSGGNGLAKLAQITSPAGIYVSKDGEVFFTDYGNHGIRKILKN